MNSRKHVLEDVSETWSNSIRDVFYAELTSHQKVALIMLINAIWREMTDHILSPAIPPPFNDVDFLF